MKEKTNRGKSGIAYNVIGILYILAVAALVVSVYMVGVLPMMYFGAIAAVLAVISIPVLIALFGKSKTADGAAKTGKKKFASVVAVLMILVSGAGTYYMASTMDFFGNISKDVQTHEYYVVVRADSEYELLKDISGKSVGIMKDTDKLYDEAKDELADKVDVKFTETGGFDALAKSLIDEKSEAVFMNSAFYDMALEEVDGFTKDNTRILYCVEVEAESGRKTGKIDVTKDSFNVYVSGLDTSGSIANVSRSDLNMLMTVNPKTRTILLTSIPRDYYVELASKGAMDKLTHSGIYGIDETTATVGKLLDTNIDYYLKVNFSTVTDLVDELGGITVNSDYAFSTVGFDFVEGENFLNGKQALAFSRERYSFSDGDNQRIRNQQAVIVGIINKCAGSPSILTNYTGILGAVKDSMQTSMSQKEIKSLVKMQIGDMRKWTIIRQSVTGDGLMTPVYSMPNTSVYVMVPDKESVESAKIQIDEVMGE